MLLDEIQSVFGPVAVQIGANCKRGGWADEWRGRYLIENMGSGLCHFRVILEAVLGLFADIVRVIVQRWRFRGAGARIIRRRGEVAQVQLMLRQRDHSRSPDNLGWQRWPGLRLLPCRPGEQRNREARNQQPTGDAHRRHRTNSHEPLPKYLPICACSDAFDCRSSTMDAIPATSSSAFPSTESPSAANRTATTRSPLLMGTMCARSPGSDALRAF